MLVINNLFLKDGQTYPKIYFNGSKETLLGEIEYGGMVTFINALEGRTKELNVQAGFIVSYETEVVAEEVGLDLGDLEGVQVFLFPTAGFGADKAFKPVGKSPLEELLKVPGLFSKFPFGK